MHLLQSGNDLSLIKDWMGHADLNTTHAYVEIDMKMKRRALEACQPPKAKTTSKRRPKWLKPGILEWLEDLSKGAGIMCSRPTCVALGRPPQRTVQYVCGGRPASGCPRAPCQVGAFVASLQEPMHNRG